jgi:hypothetical protein
MIALLDLAFLEAAENSGHGPIRLGLQNFCTTKVSFASEYLDSVFRPEAVVGSNRDSEKAVEAT